MYCRTPWESKTSYCIFPTGRLIKLAAISYAINVIKAKISMKKKEEVPASANANTDAI
jgi:hypothetical protein